MTSSISTSFPKRGSIWGVRLICALALIMVGFAHKAPILDHPVFNLAQLAAYTLPDGTVPTLCITVQDDSHTDHPDQDAHPAKECEACRIASATLMPTPPDTGVAIVRSFVIVDPAPHYQVTQRRLLPPNQGPRAPPSIT